MVRFSHRAGSVVLTHKDVFSHQFRFVVIDVLNDNVNFNKRLQTCGGQTADVINLVSPVILDLTASLLELIKVKRLTCLCLSHESIFYIDFTSLMFLLEHPSSLVYGNYL